MLRGAMGEAADLLRKWGRREDCRHCRDSRRAHRDAQVEAVTAQDQKGMEVPSKQIKIML